MTDTSPAAELRQAAETLRRLATNATPGPWRAEYSAKSGNCVIDAESHNALDSVARTMHYRAGYDSDYIATMHPGVGLALADLLDNEASAWGSPLRRDGLLPPYNETRGRLLTDLARLINGGAA